MQIKNYKHAKKNKANKKLYFLILFPLVITGLFFYALYQAVTYIERRDLEIYNNAWEAGYWHGGIEATTPSETPKITPVSTSNYRADKDTILKKLAEIESRSGKVRKLLDTNNRYSLGLYHFQAHTVKDMYKRYYKQNITITEAVAIAQDDELATKLAHDAIFVKGEKWHWHNSMIKMEKAGLVAYNK